MVSIEIAPAGLASVHRVNRARYRDGLALASHGRSARVATAWKMQQHWSPCTCLVSGMSKGNLGSPAMKDSSFVSMLTSSLRGATAAGWEACVDEAIKDRNIRFGRSLATMLGRMFYRR